MNVFESPRPTAGEHAYLSIAPVASVTIRRDKKMNEDAAAYASGRPIVDVVVPFLGSRAELVDLLGRLDRIRLRQEDTLTVVDNRPSGVLPVSEDPRVMRAPERQWRGFARNAGARRGRADWLVFIDDIEPAPDLVDQYFAAGPPADDVAVLAGAIHDMEPPAGRRQWAARYAFLRKSMAQRTTKAQLGPFAKTANAAVRRVAFEAIGGFRTEFGEDVDLCYRLHDAGWRLEFRDEAIVEHRGHRTVRSLLAQQSRHGAGAAWLDVEYPGFSPPYRWSSLVVSLVRGVLKSAWARGRGDRDRALIEILDPLTALAFHLGRFRSNGVEPNP